MEAFDLINFGAQPKRHVSRSILKAPFQISD